MDLVHVRDTHKNCTQKKDYAGSLPCRPRNQRPCGVVTRRDKEKKNHKVISRNLAVTHVATALSMSTHRQTPISPIKSDTNLLNFAHLVGPKHLQLLLVLLLQVLIAQLRLLLLR